MQQRPMAIAMVAGVAAALCAAGFLSRREAELMQVTDPVAVVAAAAEIASGEVLGEPRLERIEVPRRFVEPGALAEISEAAGRIAVVPIRAGMQVTASLARRPAEATGIAGIIPAGRRAVSIALPSTAAVAGLVRPNDLVDVLATFDLGAEAAVRRTTLAVVSGAQVLAVDRRIAGGPEALPADKARAGIFAAAAPQRAAGDPIAVTLAATPEEAQALAFAQESAALAIALLPAGEESGGRTPATTISSIAAGATELVLPRKGFREYRGR